MFYIRIFLKLFFGCFLFGLCCSTSEKTAVISLDDWTYIEVDNNRAKWGDFDEPEWLKYFGLSAFDATGDGYQDVVAGRYFYRNPGGDMTGKWERVDFGFNVDGILFVDIDGDEYADVIAEALPDVYWLEAENKEGNSWNVNKICELPKTKHVNGQGFTLGQLVVGGKPEIILSTGEGIYCLEIPEKPGEGNWPSTHIAPQASEEGIGVGDVDGDGDIDIAAGYGEKGEGMSVAWWENPGDGQGNWELHHIGSTVRFADRVAIADLNGDAKSDIVVTEERWPEPEDASVYWFEQPPDPKNTNWTRHTIVTQNTSNNLDIADMDNDGDIDIITAEHRGTEKLQIWENIENASSWQEHVVSAGKESHLGAQVFDLDNDGDLDILSIAWDDYKYLHLWRNDANRKTPF